ncbi:C2 domain-containing protein [Pilobolus umbonatus]|nr:C2 domain-containing protein [Pilobolus umbonatus]
MFNTHKFPRGVLTVKLIEARNLKKEDVDGHNDSFVELWLNKDFKQRSSIVKNTETPVWNQRFTFNIEAGSSDHKLRYKVIDQDRLDTDKIGNGSLDVTPALKGQPMDVWAKLPALLGLTSNGEVHFTVKFVPQ